MHGGEFSLAQSGFIERIKYVEASDLVKNKTLLVSEDKVRTFFKKQLGILMWTLQTRFDIGFMVTRLATTCPYVTKEAGGILEMAKLVNKIIKILKTQVIEIRYGSFFRKGEVVTESKLMSLRLFSFTDAGFASLRDHKSIETAIFIIGKEIVRDGSIRCIGGHYRFLFEKDRPMRAVYDRSGSIGSSKWN